MPAHLWKSQENLDRKRKANDLLVGGVGYGYMGIRTSLVLFPASSQCLLSTDTDVLLEKPENNMQVSFEIWLRPLVLTSSFFFLNHENVSIFHIFLVLCWELRKTCKLVAISKALSTSSVFLLDRIHPQSPRHFICGWI